MKIKRERPPMPPLAVRVQVAERQLRAISSPHLVDALMKAKTLRERLVMLLVWLERKMEVPFEGAPLELDHDPALILRPYNPRIKDVAARYTPHAHDPAALIYREKADHQHKTTGRRPGAERTITTKGSDIGIKTKFARLARKEKEAQTKKMFAGRKPNTLQGWAKIINRSTMPSRPFPKGRKFRKP